MLDRLEIRNFKSIEHLELSCRRVNVLIGEPNTGKSNILEALGLISFVGHSETANDLRQFVRYEDVSNLFYDDDLGVRLEITLSGTRPIHGNLLSKGACLQLQFSNGTFQGSVVEAFAQPEYQFQPPGRNRTYTISGNHDSLSASRSLAEEYGLGYCKFYKFAPKTLFNNRSGTFLLPPSGDNLLSLLLQNRKLLAEANALFLSRGLRLGLRPQENKIEVIKDFDDVIVSHPYHQASETFQRLVFYMAALHTNSDSVLVFEEPEAHAFPYYTKYLAERIALDERGNQYFISTHNPYFLLPILEKTQSDDIAVFITYYDNYRTQVRQMSPDELSRISDDIDVFSNIQMFLED